jgi:hypothetical protein
VARAILIFEHSITLPSKICRDHPCNVLAISSNGGISSETRRVCRSGNRAQYDHPIHAESGLSLGCFHSNFLGTALVWLNAVLVDRPMENHHAAECTDVYHCGAARGAWSMDMAQ